MQWIANIAKLLGFLTRTQSQTRLQKILKDLFPSTQNTQKFQEGKNTKKGENTIEQKFWKSNEITGKQNSKGKNTEDQKQKILYDTR